MTYQESTNYNKRNSAISIVTPGELISENAEGYLRGHGTYVENGKLYSCLCGYVEKVNKLISVLPLRSRYVGEIGDVVIGRVTVVGVKRWLVDIQARKDATLLLSSINLPGGEQRRKTLEDQLNMRNLYVENDLIVAEVQTLFLNGAVVSLQTRSSKYGKLENGQFVKVDCSLIRRCKQHIHVFEDIGLQVILGNNGYCWITSNIQQRFLKQEEEDMDNGEQLILESYQSTNRKDDKSNNRLIRINEAGNSQVEFDDSDRNLREKVSRMRNIIVCLAEENILIYSQSILDAYWESLTFTVKDILMDQVARRKIITKVSMSKSSKNI